MHQLLVFGSALGARMINSVAGGTVALWPGSLMAAALLVKAL